MSVEGPVVLSAAVGGDLSSDRRGAAPEFLGDQGERVATPDPDCDRLSLMILEPIRRS